MTDMATTDPAGTPTRPASVGVAVTSQPNTPTEHPDRTPRPNTHVRYLAWLRTGMLIFVVVLPPALNAQNIVAWASDPNGLGLNHLWAWLAFCGLDAIGAVCVFETLIQTQKGRRAGAFAVLVWLFAAASAWAGYRHGTEPGIGRDVKWFFPLMAFAGPTFLHLILGRARKDVQVDAGKRLEHTPASAYGAARWLPGVGAFTETYCAWRVGRLEGITKPAATIERYRSLRSDAGPGGLFVLRAMRKDAERGTPPNPIAERPAVLTALAERANTPALRSVPTERPRLADRPVRADVTRKPNTAPNATQPNGDVAANMAMLRTQFGDWRTNTPTVRAIAAALSVTVSTGHAYRQRLIAEQEPETSNGRYIEGAAS